MFGNGNIKYKEKEADLGFTMQSVSEWRLFMEEQKSFFEQNDEKVCKHLSKVLMWMTLVFPVLFLATALGVFQIKYRDLAILTPIGCVCTLGPMVASKLQVPARIMKYVSVLAVGLIVMLLGGNSAVGIYMTYGLAMLFSCMFFDPKFTKRIAICSYFFLVVSLFLRSQNVQQIEYPTNMEWFLTRTVGFTIEQILMSVVFISVAGSSRKILENLHNTEQVAAVVEKCEEASSELVMMVDELAGNMKQSKRASQTIVESAHDTTEDCRKSLRHVNSMQDSVSEMVQAVESINHRTDEMLEISDNIWQKMEGYVKVMEQAVDSMKEIEETANLTGNSIQNLEEGVSEISEFAGQISEITAQTNLLALNASIEAARAGEQGKGFSVVAEQVRVWAERSKDSSNAVVSVVDMVTNLLNEVKRSNMQNLTSVEAGIKQISDARNEAERLGQLQSDSRHKTEQIAQHSGHTRKYSQEVKGMAEQMEELVQNSLSRADSIVEEANGQEKITDMTGEVFQRVENIAKNLLELSKFSLERKTE